MNGGGVRLGSRIAAMLILGSVVVLAGASPAVAHGQLERSDPADGGMVPVGRSTITLWFSSPVIAEASTFDVVTDDGTAVAGRVAVGTSDGQGVVTIEVDPLAHGLYRLDWSILSDDGHRSSGSFPFGAGIRPLPGSGTESFPGGSGLLVRWLDLTAIMVAIGALAVTDRVLGSMGSAGELPRRRSRYVGAAAGAVAVAAGVVTLFARTGGSGTIGGTVEAAWSTLVGSAWGELWFVREVALVVAAVALWAWARRDGSSRWMRVSVVAMAAVVWFEPLAGHAADLPARSGLASVAAAAHLVAAGVWAGGLAVLAICLLPVMRREPDARGPMVSTAWRAFSRMAAVATVVLVATGLYESGRYLPDIDSATSTIYGGAVLGKVVLLAVALTLAGVNTLLVHPNLAEPVGRLLRRPVGWAPVSLRRFGTVVAVEVSVLLVAAVVAAVLTSVPPARDVAAATTAASTLRSANVDGLFITFEEVPAGPGTGRLIVQARSTVKPPPGPIVGATVLLFGPGGTVQVPLREVEPGRYEAETATAAGGWQATVSVRRDGQADAVMQASWTVVDPATDALRPLELVTTGLAVLLLAALALVLGPRRRARSRRPTPPRPVVGEQPVRQP